MAPFVRLTSRPLTLAPETRLLKLADYACSVDVSQMLEEAREAARILRAEAEQEYARGQRLGYEEGLHQARLEMASRMLETAERTVDYLGQIEHKVVDLVMAALRKILGEFDDRELTQRLVHQALEVVRNQPQATIRVCPTHAESLRQRLHEVLAGHANLGLVEVVADPRLGEQGCILETEIGVVEASLETQLRALERALRSRLQKRMADVPLDRPAT